MKQKLVEHILGIIFVSVVLIFALQVLNRGKEKAEQDALAHISQFVDCDFIDFHEPFHRALLRDVMNIYHPGRYDRNKKLVEGFLEMLSFQWYYK